MKRSKNYQIHISIAIAAVVIVFIGCLGFFNSSVTAADSSRTKYYTSIQIQEGDTLWSIAENYMTEEYDSIQDYIDEVSMINSLNSKTIHTGQYLNIPYYK